MVLFDASQSTGGSEIRERYALTVTLLANDMSAGDWIYADRITDRSIGTASLPVAVKAPAFNPLLANKRDFEKSAKTMAHAIRDGLAALLEKHESPCTDVLGALELAGRVFSGSQESTAPVKRLVLLSDMVQTCAPVNFRRADPKVKDANGLLADLKEAGRIPSLNGVEVWVAGAGSNPDVTPRQHRAIEAFWADYFRAAGAHLTPERYGPVLLDW
jgi:hypothetical protein